MDLRIAYNTVSKAYMGLERDGFVTTVRGSGVFVNDPEKIRKSKRASGCACRGLREKLLERGDGVRGRPEVGVGVREKDEEGA